MLATVSLPYVGTTPTYGLVLAIYFMLALPILIRVAARQGIDRGAVLGALLVGVPAGIIGARLLDALEYHDRYRGLTDLLGRNGSSIYGGLILALLIMVPYTRIVRIPLLRLLDAGAPFIAFGEAASRIACFLNGCCYGVEWDGPFSVRFPAGSFAFADQMHHGLLTASAASTLRVHPVQLYSALVSTAVGVWLLRRQQSQPREGSTFSMALIFYGVLRLAVAPLRVEALASMKAFSCVFIAIGILGLVLSQRADTAPQSRRAPILGKEGEESCSLHVF